MTIQERLKKYIKEALKLDTNPSLEVPAVATYGHYSTSVAMKLAKEQGKNPLELADTFVSKLKLADEAGMFTDITAVKPGFINFTLSPSFLQRELAVARKAGDKFGRSKIGGRKRVIVEYSAPNIAKPLHVGHLRNTMIGEALANIFTAVGYDVVRWNYLGDWGTQFGKLIAAYKMWGEKLEIKKEPIATLLALYIRFHEMVKADPSLEQLGQKEFKLLEDGNRENRSLWKWFCRLSLKEFKQLYAELGIRFDVTRGESAYQKQLKGIIADFVRRGLAKRSEGALIVPLDSDGLPPGMIEKTDGGTVYLTRDIAQLQYRLAKYKPAKILYVVGNEQSLHLQQLFAVARLAGMPAAELTHIKYGLVLDETGKKFSTREGRTVAAREVISKALTLARTTVEQKNPTLSDKEKDEIARAVGMGAIRYNDLKENRLTDVIFNWEKMLDATGDSAPYLQYTVARLLNIIRKAGTVARLRARRPQLEVLTDELEVLLMKKVLDFPDTVQLCAQTMLTSHLAKYLYELARTAGQYYEATPILSDKDTARRTARLALIETTAQTLTSGLKLLGITVPDRI